MKKFLATGLLVFLLSLLLTVAASAETGVDPTEVSSTSWTYTATLDGEDADTLTTITEGDMYLLLVIKTSSPETDTEFPSTFTAGDILYIDQKTADANDVSNHAIVFENFVPMNYTGGKAFMTGGDLASPTYIGYLESHGIMGNVDGDENGVTIIDARYILQYLAGSRDEDFNPVS
jgi:hypothetical protein